MSFFIMTVGHAQQKDGDITVTVDGLGISKSDALLQAKRTAVEKGIGTVLISQTEVENFEVKKDIILTKTTGAVKRYNILNEEKQTDGAYFVKIKAVVSLDSIKADLAALKILLESMDKPRMMVMIKEEGGNSAETAILDYLTEKEFDLVDPAAVAALMNEETELIKRATEGDPTAAAQIGAANGAEYVIVGKATKSIAESSVLASSGLKSGQSNLTAKVINCSTAKIIASKSQAAAAVHISEDIAKTQATTKAAQKLMDRKLFEKIVASFQDMLNNGIPLDVIVTNVKKFKLQKAVRQTIKDLPSVVSVNKRKFGGGKLILSVLYKGTPDSFSEAADGIAVAGKTMAVTDMEGSRVVIELE